jgi:hypothetical protein
MSYEIHQGDIKTVYQVTIEDDGVAVDVSAATVTLTFKWPDGTSEEVAATFVTDGTDGQVEYEIPSGKLTQPGMMKVQAKVDYSGGGGGTWYTNISDHRVHRNL